MVCLSLPAICPAHWLQRARVRSRCASARAARATVASCSSLSLPPGVPLPVCCGRWPAASCWLSSESSMASHGPPTHHVNVAVVGCAPILPDAEVLRLGDRLGQLQVGAEQTIQLVDEPEVRVNL